ncbi:MAG TPA: serine/threonine-protein kinase, partial [Candidatus Polarisedimenticolaceae bacterium]|nr:serine/threonine-protein kinase [Candidatus Polarisedimenticolaceae bacterium]
MEHPQPRSLGPYVLEREIGRGGMGLVYAATDPRLGRRVAIKTLLPELAVDPTARQRFLREARAAGAISHPHVTQIYDIGEHEGRVYFAMEYLDGRSLHELLREDGPLAPERAVELLRQAAWGLKAAAERGIIHRDVKPSNLFLTRQGALKITDFGLAKETLASTGLTQQGELIGTPDYISPERANGAAQDVRSDIYSLGVTFYELLAGRLPFSAASPLTVVLHHLRSPVPPLREARPAVPPPLAALIQRMLAKAPAARPQSYDELLAQ